MDVVGPIAAASNATVVLGVNVDDLGDHRPGQKAAEIAGAEFPLVAAGFTKSDVREASRRMGLRTWDKPAAACLASRIPYGTEVSVDILGGVDRAEAALHRLGFAQVRVRHYGETARIELDADVLAEAVEQRGRDHRRREGRRLPVRHARPRGIPVGQSQRLSRRGVSVTVQATRRRPADRVGQGRGTARRPGRRRPTAAGTAGPRRWRSCARCSRRRRTRP